MIEPKIGREWAVCRRRDDAVFQNIGGLQAQDANRFDADIVISGEVRDRGVWLVGDCARKNVGRAAALVRDVNEWNLDLFVGAVEIKVKARELANPEFAVDMNASVDFFAGVAVGFEADFRFEQLDLRGRFGSGECRLGFASGLAGGA